jgi:hypothetical protein
MNSLSFLRGAPRQLIDLYWDSGVANDVPALAWFLLSSLVPLEIARTQGSAISGSPTSDPRPMTTFSTPSGSSAPAPSDL